MKTCNACQVEKSFSEFYKRKANKDGYCGSCKLCDKKYYKDWQEQSPERKNRHAEWKVARVAENRLKLASYLNEHPCVDCGFADIRALEFDHIGDDKIAGVAIMVGQGVAWSKVEDEIAKCEVRCKNCHSIITAIRGNWWTNMVGCPNG